MAQGYFASSSASGCVLCKERLRGKLDERGLSAIGSDTRWLSVRLENVIAGILFVYMGIAESVARKIKKERGFRKILAYSLER